MTTYSLKSAYHGRRLAHPAQPRTTELLLATQLIRAGHGLRFDDLVPWGCSAGR